MECARALNERRKDNRKYRYVYGGSLCEFFRVLQQEHTTVTVIILLRRRYLTPRCWQGGFGEESLLHALLLHFLLFPFFGQIPEESEIHHNEMKNANRENA